MSDSARTEVVKDLGFLAVKSLITLNSGAFIVLLTFIGNVSGEAAFTIELGAMKGALYLFLAGIAGAFLAIAVTYIDTQRHLKWRDYDDYGVFLFKMIAPSAISFLLFVLGVATAISGIGE